MKYLRHVICLILSAGILIPLHAQPVTVDVRLTQPPPNQLKVADLWKIDLNNRSGKTVRIFLHGTAEEMSVPDGIIADAHSAEFDCPPGLFRINAKQISPIDVDESNDRYREALLSTGNVPTGDYQICVEVIDAETQAILGRDCKFTTVNRMSVPILIAPPDESDVPDKYPVFTWMASVPPGPNQRILYKITVAEMFGTQTPADAIRRNPAWFTQRSINRTILQYPVSARGFMKGQKYAWMIEAYEERGTEVVTLGESEIWWFTYQPMEPDVPEEGGDQRVASNTITTPVGECPGDNWDFEIGSLACWEVAGESFADDPVVDAHPVLGSVGQQGKYWVSSYGPVNADEAVGSMLSQEVKIQNSTVAFLFGGVPGAQCEVELLIEAIQNDTFTLQKRSLPGSSSQWWIAASTSAADAASNDRLVPIEWDVLRFLNRTARVLVIDSSKVAHINVDDFKFLDKEKLDTVKYPVLVMTAGEEHSLVATPEDKPAPKLRNDLLADANRVSHGRSIINEVNVVNETSQNLKGARVSMMQNMEQQGMFKNNIQGNQGGASENEEPQMPDYYNMQFTEGVQTSMNLSQLAALIIKNQVWGWGDNSDATVGPGLPGIVKEPKQVKGVQHVTALEAGVWNSFGVEKTGNVKAWGENEHAQLGTGDRSRHSTPIQINGITKVAKVASSAYSTAAATTDGSVYVWGWNRMFGCGIPFPAYINATTGQIDSTAFARMPVKHPKLANVVDIAAGEAHTIAASTGGLVVAWGSNSHGQTGRPMDEEWTVIPMLIKVGPGRNVRAVAAGFDHSLALDKDGSVWAFGGNASGQLGDGTTKDRSTAQRVTGLGGIRAIAAGDGYSLALDTAGHVWAWGNNVLGQLGDGTRVGRFLPVQVTRLDAVTGIVAGGAHAMAVRADGGLWTWGTNAVGQLGEGPITNLTPVPLNPPIGPLRVERLATK